MKRIIELIKSHKLSFIALFIVFVLLVSYLIYGSFISFKMNNLIEKGLNFEEYDDEISNYISKIDYEEIMPMLKRDYKMLQNNPSVKITKEHPFVFIFPFQQRITYSYSFSVFDEKQNEQITGIHNAKITIEIEYAPFSFSVKDVITYP